VIYGKAALVPLNNRRILDIRKLTCNSGITLVVSGIDYCYPITRVMYITK